MVLSSYSDISEQIDELILALERDEDQFFVVLEYAYQMRDELKQLLDLSDSDIE